MKGTTMKRLGVFVILTFLLWSAVPVGANSVPTIAITCDLVTVTWESFPERPVDLHVTVTEGDELTTATVSTNGAPAGEASVPVHLHTGSASASVTWTLQQEHSAGPVTADLECTPTPSTTEPPPSTTSTVPSTTVPPDVPTTAPAGCGENTLACTGSSGTPWTLGVGGYLVALGAVFMALNRRGA